MEGIRSMIVPVDFGSHAEKLADFACYMANKLNAKPTFVHVVRTVPDVTDFDAEISAQLEGQILLLAEQKMTAFMKAIKKKFLECEGDILRGDIVDAIIAYAKEKNADLIVISTHGAKGIEKILLGSVADRVIKGAPCPILVFNPFKNERGYEVCSPLTSCVPPM